MYGGIEGFCVYNNVAIGAKYAIKQYESVKRVVIFDWDIHHGNSTYKFLKDDPNVLFISLHRFDNGNFYPGKLGSIQNNGESKGKGLKIHVPWSMFNKSHMIGTQDYIYLMERVLYPVCKEFSPDLILISSGFDSAKGDPLGELSVYPEGYAYIVKRL